MRRGLLLAAAVGLLAACGKGAEPSRAGELTVGLFEAGNDAGALLLTISGGTVESVRAAGGQQVSYSTPADLRAIEIQRVLGIAEDLDPREESIGREVEIPRSKKRDRDLPAELMLGPDPLRSPGDIEELVRVQQVELAVGGHNGEEQQ